MIDFEVQKFTRRCAATNRELAPGEAFYSVLIPEGGQVRRYDYAEVAWQGPPDNAIASWRSEVPHPHVNRMQLAPSEVLLQYFESIFQEADDPALVYVLALLMIRRRIFKLEGAERREDGSQQMLVYCARNEKEYSIAVQTPGAEQIAPIQQQLEQLLFAKSA